METNAQTTVVTIFQHVQIFYTMLDHYVDNSKSIVGFQISKFEDVVESYLRQYVPDRKDQARVRATLSVENMKRCGLLSHVNDSKGQFSLHRGLLQTIQSLDSKRIRELGQPDLDIIYAQVKSLYDFFRPLGGAYDRGDTRFQENLAALFDCLQDILSKIDHNVRALEGSSKRLSEILDSHDFNDLNQSDQVRSALNEIIHISQRNINPTLTFLNERAMAQDASAMYLIRRIKESFRSNSSFSAEHSNIAAIEMKLLSYSEIVKDIRKRLYRYVEMDNNQRELYNAVEFQFNQLHEKVLSKLDTKLKGRGLDPSDEIFARSRMFSGLLNWSRSNISGQLIEVPASGVSAHVEEHIRDMTSRYDSLQGRKRAATGIRQSSIESQKRRKRVNQILSIMKGFDASTAVDDLYLAVHDFLLSELPGYTLQELFDAKQCISSKRWRKIKTMNRNEIEHKSKRLSYSVTRLKPVSHG